MKAVRRAVIDVGTNSVKLLVADVNRHEVQPVREESQQTRLGKGFYETRRLQPQAVAQTAAAVAAFAATARELGAAALRVIATSAARDATNTRDLTSAIQRASGLAVEVLSGDQEADWAFRGIATEPALAREPLLLVDVGGGSTQFIIGRGGRTQFRRSVPLGTLRLFEKLPVSDPPTAGELTACRRWLQSFLDGEVGSSLDSAPGKDLESGLRHAGPPAAGRFSGRLVGTGGTATILGRMVLKMETFDRVRIEAVRPSLPEIRKIVQRLWSLPIADRKRIPGLPASRADVVLYGVAIFEAVMEHFGFAELHIRTRGIRFGALVDGA